MLIYWLTFFLLGPFSKDQDEGNGPQILEEPQVCLKATNKAFLCWYTLNVFISLSKKSRVEITQILLEIKFEDFLEVQNRWNCVSYAKNHTNSFKILSVKIHTRFIRESWYSQSILDSSRVRYPFDLLNEVTTNLSTSTSKTSPDANPKPENETKLCLESRKMSDFSIQVETNVTLLKMPKGYGTKKFVFILP